LPDGTRRVACRPGFFLHVRVLSRLFRRLFLEGLMTPHRAGRLAFFGDLSGLADAKAFAAYLAPPRETERVVHAKPPFGGPEACWPISADTPTHCPAVVCHANHERGSRSRTAV
jgi:hypothetical protein